MSSGSEEAGAEKDGRDPGRRKSGSPRLSQLTSLLKAHRDGLQPEDVGIPPREGRGRSALGLSQRQTARLAHMDPNTYAKLERGEYRATDEQIDAVVQALRMDDTVRDRLFVLIQGKYPKMKPGASRDPNNHLREFVQDMVAWENLGEKGIIFGPLAFTTDPFFNITAYNEGFATLFEDGGIPINALTWGLLGGDGRLLNHDLHLLNEARLRVEVLRNTHGYDPRFQEIDELFKSLPPSDTPSARRAKGLQEDVFPYQPPGYAAGSIRSSETHITGVGGLSDGSSFFMLTFYENVDPDELRENPAGGRKDQPRSKIRRLSR